MADYQVALALRQALTHLRSREFYPAEAICQEILRRDKRNVSAWHLLAAVANAQKAFDKAESCMHKCAALRPNDPDMLFKLATVHAAQGRFKEAISGLNKVLKLKPDYPFALGWKAEVLERRGDDDEARALVEQYVKAGTEDAHMAAVFATVEQRAERHHEAIEVAERHVHKPDLPDVTRQRLWYLIGRSYEELGEFDQAFEAYSRAKGITPGAFDIDYFRRKTDKFIETFSSETLANLPRASNRSELPVFVVGMPRTGSTLVEQIIDAHPLAHGAGELLTMGRLVGSLAARIGSLLPYPDCLRDLTRESVDRLSQAYLDELARKRRSATRIVDKFLGNFEHLGLIQVLFPRACVIDCRRDPLDTCLSCFVSPLGSDDHPYCSDLRQLGLVYREYLRLMRHWHEVLQIRMMQVRYEQLVADQEGVSRAIIDFCGLEWHDNCLRFHESARPVQTVSYHQIRRAMYGSSVGRARKFEKHLQPLKDALGAGE